MRVRTMRPRDEPAVAELIHDSTNHWYTSRGHGPIFPAGPASTRLFCEVYEALDPGCCLLAEADDGGLAGSCFFHPRETHVSLGIMNVHPAHAGRGVASLLLKRIVAEADARGLPLRLVSSAFNLDSFSLYTRQGFVPRALYQDLVLAVPRDGLPLPPADAARLRDARGDDLPALCALDREINGLERTRDLRFFLANRSGHWHASVYTAADGRIEGFLASIAHPGSSLLGPGLARTEAQAAALIARELDHRRGATMVFLVPADRPALVHAAYALGARNCELHVAQVRGAWSPPAGVNLPTFMPETG